ncbi:MAG TPA: hypothetical protein PLG43_01105 [Spirochaetia bacterium]|jgi:hypothetical protein|nr:hypothetical protein [Spirochaetia bacterium]
MRKAFFTLLVSLLLISNASLFAQDLKIDYQYNLSAPDYANNFFYFAGKTRYLDSGASRFTTPDGKPVDGKDGLDATTQASKYKSTEFFNAYQYDILGKQIIPSGLRGLFLFALCPESQRIGDGLQVIKNSDGSLLIHYVHRGTAYEFSTDASGKIEFPTKGFKKRVIGHTDNTIHTDFSPTGKVANVDWKKVWDTSIADGKQVGSTPTKTGKVSPDMPDPTSMFYYEGALKTSLSGSILKISGDLTVKKR